MAIYKCMSCGYEYSDKLEGVPWTDLSDDCCCAVCGKDKSMYTKLIDDESTLIGHLAHHGMVMDHSGVHR